MNQEDIINRVRVKVQEVQAMPGVNRAHIIKQRLKAVEESQEQMIKVMDQLQGDYIYYRLTQGVYSRQNIAKARGNHWLYIYSKYVKAEASGYRVKGYNTWREGIDLGAFQHC